ncbi:MAG: DMT family transporter [Actinobacteria bacterium]|nr:DMT family transporter [Actinomycetota bacterium]
MVTDVTNKRRMLRNPASVLATVHPGRIRVMAEIGLGIAGVIWGVNFVLVKFAMEHMPALYYLGLRFLVAAVLLAPFSVARLKKLNRAGWLLGIGVGALLFAGFVLQTYGLRMTSPGISGFLTSLYVIMVPLLLGLVSGRWPSPLVGVGVIVVVGGLALLSLYGRMGFGWGEGLTLLATLFWALHILGVDYGSNRISAIAFVELQLGTCAVLSLICSSIIERPGLFPGWGATGAVLWTGIMGGVVAYVLMVLGQRYTPPTLAGLLMSLEAVFALIVSIAVGYDHLTLRALVGFILVFAGTTVARMGSKKEPEIAAEPAPPAP